MMRALAWLLDLVSRLRRILLRRRKQGHRAPVEPGSAPERGNIYPLW